MIALEHVHRTNIDPAEVHTRIKVQNMMYHWRGHKEFLETESGRLLAEFHPSWLEGRGHKIGRLMVTKEGRSLLDVLVLTALVVQERSEEQFRSVIAPFIFVF